MLNYNSFFFIIIILHIGSLPNLSNGFMSSSRNEVYNPLALLQTSFSFVSGNESGTGNEPTKREPVPQTNYQEEVESLQYQLGEVRRRYHELESRYQHDKSNLYQRNQNLISEIRHALSSDQSSIISLNRSLQHEVNRLLQENLVSIIILVNNKLL